MHICLLALYTVGSSSISSPVEQLFATDTISIIPQYDAMALLGRNSFNSQQRDQKNSAYNALKVVQ